MKWVEQNQEIIQLVAICLGAAIGAPIGFWLVLAIF